MYLKPAHFIPGGGTKHSVIHALNRTPKAWTSVFWTQNKL